MLSSANQGHTVSNFYALTLLLMYHQQSSAGWNTQHIAKRLCFVVVVLMLLQYFVVTMHTPKHYNASKQKCIDVHKL